jgi:hypothetical protein
MLRSLVLWLGLLLAACGSDPLVGAMDAVRTGDHYGSIVKLRPIAAKGTGDPAIDTKIGEVYIKALADYRDELSGPTATKEACDTALRDLGAIADFGDPAAQITQDEATKGEAAQGEADILTQALLCSARHGLTEGSPDEAAKVVIEGMKRVPGFEPGSASLAKALREPAFRYARSGSVAEATALAQAVFGAGDRGLATAIVNALEASQATPNDIYPVLADRANRAKISAAASSLAADFGIWHGKAAEAQAWFDQVADSAGKGHGEHAQELAVYASERGEEASRVAQNTAPACEISSNAVTVAEVPYVAALEAAPVDGGVVVLWLEGEKLPEQRLKMAKVMPDGSKGAVVTVEDPMPPAPPAEASDVWAPYAFKNRLTTLSTQKCGGVIEVQARGAPQGGWVRATLGDDGDIASPAALVDKILAKETPMPAEDVRSSLGCSSDRLVYLWLANIQLLRLTWFKNGTPSGKVPALRLPGFSPGFVAYGMEKESTNVTWIDIMGVDSAGIQSIVLGKNGEIPLTEPPPPAEGEEPSKEKVMDLHPVVENCGARTEQIKLADAGTTRAVVYYPKRGNVMARFLDTSGRPMGAELPVAPVRADANKLLFDAEIAGSRLGVVWAEELTERWGTVTFQSIGTDGMGQSPPQRVAGLARPDITPVVVAAGTNVFTVAWVDRTSDTGESVRFSVLRCGGR